jgi:hypothetical protein
MGKLVTIVLSVQSLPAARRGGSIAGSSQLSPKKRSIRQAAASPEASLTREGSTGSIDSIGSLARDAARLARAVSLQLRGSAGIGPAFPMRIRNETTPGTLQVNRKDGAPRVGAARFDISGAAAL